VWSLPPLYRYNPELEEAGKNPLTIDSKAPTISFADYALNENRYRMLKMAGSSSRAGLRLSKHVIRL
jgi:pyruvate-ferredoxin/flavodoxin oxidoreductase